MRWLLALVVVLSLGVSSCKYEADLGFLNDAQANYFSYLVQINGKNCIDMDGIIGQCSKRVTDQTDLVFKMPVRPYLHRLNFVCSNTMNEDFTIEIKANEEYQFDIPHTSYPDSKSFTCAGEIVPLDRITPVTSRFEVRVKIYDEKYIPAPVPRYRVTKKNIEIAAGQFAKHTIVCVDGKCEAFKEDTSMRVKRGKDLFIWTETEIMRNQFVTDSLD